MRIVTAGEDALILYLGEKMSPAVAARIRQTGAQLRLLMGAELIDLTPSYTSLLVTFNPLTTSHRTVRARIQQAVAQPDSGAAASGRLVSLPVYYSPESGPDLADLAAGAGLSIEQVIAIHQQREYLVYAIGFAPGFAFLGEVDPRIARPRFPTPRLRVPRGSVAIAGAQTAVYPAATPGGWNLIGRCPTRMFDPESEPNMPVGVGDRVRFQAIERQQFLTLGGEL